MAGREKVSDVVYKLVIVVWCFVHLQSAGCTNVETTTPDAITIESTILIENVSVAEATTSAIPINGKEVLELNNVTNSSDASTTSTNAEIVTTSSIAFEASTDTETVSTTTPVATELVNLIASTTSVPAINHTTSTSIDATEILELRNVSVNDVEITNSTVNINDTVSLVNGTINSVSTKNKNIELEKLSETNATSTVFNASHNDDTGNIDDVTASGNCAGFPLLNKKYQPIHTAAARIKKCCPDGQNYDISNKTGAFKCTKENVKFNAPIIDAVFYQHCIEDTEQPITLETEYGIKCDDAMLYNENYGDLLYVLKNGSLLRVRHDFSSYDVSNDYCLDMHREDKILTALVCAKQGDVQVSRAEAYIYATCLLVSVPCLFVTTFFYIHIDELRNLHGKSLACHSLCLAIAFLLISVAQIRNRVPQSVGYVIQYFMLACFLWVAVMCADICIHVWWYLPKYKTITQRSKTRRFIIYSIISFGVPLILVLMSYSAQEPGQSSYYLKGVREDTRTPLNYFIPPISSILIICFGLLIGSYFGFRNILELEAKAYIMQKSTEDGAAFYNQSDHAFKVHIDDVERTARSTAYLYLIMTINWIFEIISFYTQAPSSSSLVLFDVLNALQGVVIFIIFLCLPRPKRIISRWWKSQGSLECNNTEMEQNGKAFMNQMQFSMRSSSSGQEPVRLSNQSQLLSSNKREKPNSQQ